MYEQMFTDMKDRMQPMMDLAETNKKAMETLTVLQKDSMTDMFNASLEQFKALSQCKDPKAALELQMSFYKDMEGKMASAAEKSMSVMTETKETYVSVMEESAKKTTAEVEEAFKKVSENVAV